MNLVALRDAARHTVEKVTQEHKDVLDDVGPLACRLKDAGRAFAADEECCEALKVVLYDLLLLTGLCPVDRPDLRKLSLRDSPRANSPFPGNRSLADVVLQRRKICRRIETHRAREFKYGWLVWTR